MKDTFRMQRKRSKGWRKPEGSVCISRGTRWGNPFKIGDPGVETALIATQLFHAALLARQLNFDISDIQRELAGKVLLCWCHEREFCHGDVLVHYATHRNETIRVDDIVRVGVRLANLDITPINAMIPDDVSSRLLTTMLFALRSFGLTLGFSFEGELVKNKKHQPRSRHSIREGLALLDAAVALARVETGQPWEVAVATTHPDQIQKVLKFHTTP